MNVGERIVSAIARLPHDHDLGITWSHDERMANAGSGVNVFAGFPYAVGNCEHLDRIEGIAAALENMADESDKRAHQAWLDKQNPYAD